MGDEVRGAGPYDDLVGSTATLTRTVTAADTAISLGSGDVPVLGTPRLVAWLEAATVAALSRLPDGITSVGVRVDVEHVRASPVGAEIACTATVLAAEARVLTCEVEARESLPDGSVVSVGGGRVVRSAVDRARFLGRLPHG